MCTPEPDFFVRFKKCILAFLWENKKAKIAYNRLIKSYEAGGLKLVDLETKNYALKAKWIQLLRLNSMPNTLWDAYLPCMTRIQNIHVWQINMTQKDIKSRYPKSLWREIALSWLYFMYNSPKTTQGVKKQVIWFNSHIKDKNKVMFIDEWYRAGILCVSDLIHDDNTFKTCQEMINDFGIVVNVIDYYRVMAAIPKEWKTLLKHTINEGSKSLVEEIADMYRISNVLYKHRILAMEKHTKERFLWEQELLCEISDRQWEDNFQNVCKMTKSTKLRFFHYRIVNRYLTTNCQVARWNTNVSSLCTFCNNEEETILHMLYLCPKVKKIWSALQRWLNYFCALNCDFDGFEIIFNGYKDSFPVMVNCIILITKYYIYVQKCLDKPLNFVELIAKISHYNAVEKRVCFSESGKLYDKYCYNWCMFDML